MSSFSLSLDTATLISTVFDAEHQPAARTLLEEKCGFNLPGSSEMTDSHLERIHFAVLRLSLGSIEKLYRAVETASGDWRDSLVGAGFGEDLDAHKAWFRERVGV
jgi:hypothetical protein